MSSTTAKAGAGRAISYTKRGCDKMRKHFITAAHVDIDGPALLGRPDTRTSSEQHPHQHQERQQQTQYLSHRPISPFCLFLPQFPSLPVNRHNHIHIGFLDYFLDKALLFSRVSCRRALMQAHFPDIAGLQPHLRGKF